MKINFVPKTIAKTAFVLLGTVAGSSAFADQVFVFDGTASTQAGACIRADQAFHYFKAKSSPDYDFVRQIGVQQKGWPDGMYTCRIEAIFKPRR